jgi:hypothetical protein
MTNPAPRRAGPGHDPRGAKRNERARQRLPRKTG